MSPPHYLDQREKQFNSGDGVYAIEPLPPLGGGRRDGANILALKEFDQQR
jgi:hypothetical protein